MSERPSVHTDTGMQSVETGLPYDSDLLKNEKICTRINLINEELKRCLLDEDGEPKELYETASHLILAGGKRLRSLLLILCCEAVGGTVVDALPFAVATEFVQSASLIHDDVIDDDNMRRGVETTHKKYGGKMAIISGDLLIGLAIKLIGERASPQLLTSVATAGIKMCEGEAADLLMSKNKEQFCTTKTALDIISMKTVSFMTYAAKVGAMVGHATEEQSEILMKYAEMLGYTFQIRDDILDIVATQNGTEKTILSDLKGGRSNFVLAHALESCSPEKRREIAKQLNDGNVDFVFARIREMKSIEYSTEIAKNYMEAAKDIIRGFGFFNEDLLILLADFAMKRLY
jgi:geranylgeranyl diphosphate synthase type I